MLGIRVVLARLNASTVGAVRRHIEIEGVFLGKASPKSSASDQVAHRVVLLSLAEHALCIGDGVAQHKESIADLLLTDAVEIWDVISSGALLLDLDSVLQAVDLFHILRILRIDQNADYHRTITCTHLFSGPLVAAGTLIDGMSVLLSSDHLHRPDT